MSRTALYTNYILSEIPDSEDAHRSGVSFLHASFGDYLINQARSQDFYVDRGESVDEIARSLFKLYLDKPYTELEGYTPPRPLGLVRHALNIYQQLKLDAEDSPYFAITGKLKSERGSGPLRSQEDRSECLEALSQISLTDILELGPAEVMDIIKFLVLLWDVCCVTCVYITAFLILTTGIVSRSEKN